MKNLIRCLVITGVVLGLIAGRRPPGAVRSLPTVIVSSRISGASPATWALVEATDAAPLPAPARGAMEDELTRALRRNTPADRERAFKVLLPDLVARDPALAGHLALAWEPGALRDEILRQFIRQWAATDLGGVITWVTSLLDKTDRQNAAQAATAQVAEDDPAGAIELAQLLHVGVDDGSIEHLAQLWTEENPREAVDWIVARPADLLRDRLLARIAWTRASTNPAEAAGLVVNQMTAGAARDEALMGVVRQWAGRDPAPAGAWVAQFSSGPLRDRALAAVAAASQLR